MRDGELGFTAQTERWLVNTLVLSPEWKLHAGNGEKEGRRRFEERENRGSGEEEWKKKEKNERERESARKTT